MEDEPRDTCFGAGSVAGAVIGTFLTTILLLLVAALLYRQWRRHKGESLAFSRGFRNLSYWVQSGAYLWFWGHAMTDRCGLCIRGPAFA